MAAAEDLLHTFSHLVPEEAQGEDLGHPPIPRVLFGILKVGNICAPSNVERTIADEVNCVLRCAPGSITRNMGQMLDPQTAADVVTHSSFPYL
ncbi:hypothetical protein CF336_g4832 [Tilletia laevis]|nr:hypothetical protein CF336_g4832 [Tilletia laevis]